MVKEDIEFLRELQHELNTQETDHQSDPRFWGIEETSLEACAEGDGDPYIFTYDYDSKESFEDYIKSIDDEIGELSEDDSESNLEIINSWREDINKDDVDEVVDFVNEHLRKKYCEDNIVWMKEDRRISIQTGCFLTKRAAKNYLKKNYYHHNNGCTFAMTAWRNPEFERLLKILQTMDIDDIKITEPDNN